MIRNVVCAMSGGVDSAVAALLLKRQGFNVTGVFMRNWDITNEVGVCSVDKDCEDAKYICNHIGIPFREVNFIREYWNDVFSELVQGYTSGMTPNPDVLCNKYIKFGRLFNYAMEQLGADAVATGHYARNSAGQFLQHRANCSQGVKLLTSCDQSKDQTLFLSQISQHALQRSMFPVGGLIKSSVKQMALEAGLDSIVKKRESVGICFIGTRCFKDFIEQYVEPTSGEFVDVDTGQVVGQHRGVHYWTIGQRALIPGLSKAYFVCARDSNTQVIHVASGTDHPALFSQSLITGPMHWINQSIPQLNSAAYYESLTLSEQATAKNSSTLCEPTLNKRNSGSVNDSTIESSSSASVHKPILNDNNSSILSQSNSENNSSKNNAEPVSLQFRFQHTYPLIGCKVSKLTNGRLCMILDQPIRALAAGQYAVLYKDGIECLGSAQIVHVGQTMSGSESNLTPVFSSEDDVRVMKHRRITSDVNNILVRSR